MWKKLYDVTRKLESESLILFEWFHNNYLKANNGKSLKKNYIIKKIYDVTRKLESESLILFEWFHDNYLKDNIGNKC